MTFRYTLVLSLFVLLCHSCKKKEENPPPNPGPGDTTAKKSWKVVGNKIAANNINAHATIVVDTSGVPYIVYQDGNNGNKATVVKLQDSMWSVVGSSGFSPGAAHRPSIVLSNTTALPFVTFLETSTAATNKINVMQFTGSDWKQVGSAYFQANSTCTPSLSIDNNGNPSVAFVAPPFTGRVMRYNGSSWSESFISPLGRRVYDIDLSHDEHYLSYLWDTTLSITHLDVLRKADSNWNNLNFPSNISPTSYCLTTNNDVPFIAIEGKGPIRKASVYNLMGGWKNIGDQDFTGGIAADPYLVIGNDSAQTPYLTFKDGNGQAVMMYFKEDNWNNLGIDFPKISASHVSVATDPKKHLPYLAVTNTFDGSITILRYD